MAKFFVQKHTMKDVGSESNGFDALSGSQRSEKKRYSSDVCCRYLLTPSGVFFLE